MYCSVLQVTEAATQMVVETKTGSSPTSVSNETLLELIERASRIIDLVCGLPSGYFVPAYYPVWKSSHTYSVGDIITPTTRNLHRYRVTTAGISGLTEPTFPTSSGSTVGSGSSPVFTEYGADVTASSRTFYGDGTNYLRVDPYVAGTLSGTITVPDNYTAPTFLERDGYLVLTSNGVLPPFAPSIFSVGWWSGVAITVSALWGFASTPADIQSAVIEMVINLWREVDPVTARLINLDGMVLRESLPPRIKELCKRYRAKSWEVAFA